MANTKRSVNGRLVPEQQGIEADYSIHHVLVNLHEIVESTISPTIGPVDLSVGDTMIGVGDEKGSTSGDTLGLPSKTMSKTIGTEIEIDSGLPSLPESSTELTQTLTLTRSYLIPTGADGSFQFKVPVAEKVSGDINLKVIKPGGGVLKEKTVSYAGLKSIQDPGTAGDHSEEMVIAVDPYRVPELPNVSNPLPYKVTGRLIAFETGEPVKNWTVFIHTLLGNAPSGSEANVTAAVKTDANGYFSFYMPAGDLTEAFARIAGLEGESFPLSLSSAGTANSPQIVVIGSVDDIDQDCDQNDCGCGTSTPSLPDADDLVNSGIYSDDLGGSCVNFTTPNRSLEEFTYYSVVRTTEPEIKRVPYKKPPLLVVGDLEQAQNAPVIANGLAFDKEVAKWTVKHTDEVNLIAAFWGGTNDSLPGFDQFATTIADGSLKWWMFESALASYMVKKGKTFPGVASQDALGLNAAHDMLMLINAQGSNFFQYFCIDKATQGYKLFYGSVPQSDNDAYAFWYFAASKYFEQHGKLPHDPDDLEQYIENVLTKTGGTGPAEWWLFYVDYNTYHAPEGLTPLEYLKTELSKLFTIINEREPQLEAEVLEFLKMAINYFREDYSRIPNTPEEIFSYITANFSGDAKARRHLTGQHAIDWDETPTLYHNTTIAHGHILNFKQVWKADGYSLGDLLYSLPLAPCQKKQIAIFDWDRTESAQRGEYTDVSESLNAFLGRDRDVTDIINTSLTENTKGGSQVSTSGSSFGLGFGSGAGAAGSGSYGPFSLGVAGGNSKGIGYQSSSGSGSSSAWQNSARNATASSLNSLRDQVMQSASAVRSQRSTVVQAVNQNESVNVQTDVVANHNHCHSMTVEYFEVLRHFALEQKLADVQECLFVPLEITPFTIHKILRWRHELYRAVGGGELGQGFEALETIKNKYMVEGTGPVTIMADEEIQEMSGMLEFQINIDRPLDNIDLSEPLKATVDQLAWGFLSWLPGVRQLNDIRSNFEGKTQEQREVFYREEILPDLIAGYLEIMEFGYEDTKGQQHRIPFDLTVVPGYEDATRYMSSRSMANRRSQIRRAIRHNPQGAPLKVFMRYLAPRRGRGRMGVDTIRRSEVSRFFIRNPKDLPARSSILFNSGYINYESASLKETLFSKYNYFDDIDSTDPVMFSTNLNDRELHNPVLQNYDRANALITHLNDNLEYYHKTIWWQMDPDKRYMLLDGFVAPNSDGRSVASVVENKLLGIVGNNLVMPVVRGVHLDPTYNQKDDEPVDLFAHYAPTTPPAPFRVSVPTRGVYAEAVMGSCNSCEIIDESRHWRFSEVPCGDSPTAIQPISLDSRRSDPGDLQAKDLPTNIINLQNAPSAPAPQGYADTIKMLATPGIFENLTGLTENQQNALAALQANQKGAIDAMQMNVEAAQAYAEMAKELVTQEQMLKNGDKIMRNIDKQERNNNISPEDAETFRKQVLKNQIGGNQWSGDDAELGQEQRQPESGLFGDGGYVDKAISSAEGNISSFSAKGANGEEIEFQAEPGDSPTQVFQDNPKRKKLQSNFFQGGNSMTVETRDRYVDCLNVPVGTWWDNKYIGIGQAGQHVEFVQRALFEFGYHDILATGQFDSATLAAVLDFQQQYNSVGLLKMVDGVIGPETMRMMDTVMYYIERSQEEDGPLDPGDIVNILDDVRGQYQIEQGLVPRIDISIQVRGFEPVLSDILTLMRMVNLRIPLENLNVPSKRLDDARPADVFEPKSGPTGWTTYAQPPQGPMQSLYYDDGEIDDVLVKISANIDPAQAYSQYTLNNVDMSINHPNFIMLQDSNRGNIIQIELQPDQTISTGQTPEDRVADVRRAMVRYIQGRITRSQMGTVLGCWQ